MKKPRHDRGSGSVAFAPWRGFQCVKDGLLVKQELMGATKQCCSGTSFRGHLDKKELMMNST
jgi:hypothetical protein